MKASARWFTATVLVTLAWRCSANRPAVAQTPVLVLTNANVIDGISDQPLRQVSVTVREGRISSVASGVPSVPAGAMVIDLKGKWLLPGLIDAHVHLADLAAARLALASGVTTVRTGNAQRFIDIGIRELNHAGVADLPDVVAVGYQVVRQPSENFFLDFPGMIDLMQGVRGPDAFRRMVRALADRGVNMIKVLATERLGVAQQDARRRTLTDEELAAVIDEARRAGLTVMAHAHGDEGAAAAVRGGARTIEHGTYLSDETLALMKDRGTCLVPTMTTFLREEGDAVVAARSRANLPRLAALVARANERGIKVAAGTDIMYDDKYRQQDELVLLTQQGLSPIAAIKSATSVASECLSINARTGAIRPGLEADLIVVEGDPTADFETVRDVLMVVNNGKVAVNRLNP